MLLMNNLSVDTVVFRSASLSGLDLAHFREAGMADIYLSLFCKQRSSLLIRTYRPWGYAAIRQALAGVRQRVDDAQVHQRLEALVPALHQCLR